MQIKVGEHLFSKPDYISTSVFQNLLLLDFIDSKWDASICATCLGTKPYYFKGTNPLHLLQLKGILLEPIASLQNAQFKEYLEGKRFIDLEKLSLGTFVDLDILTSEGLSSNLTQIVSMLYRTDPEIVGQLPIQDTWPAVRIWQDFRKGVYRQYAYLFGTEASDEQESDEQESSKEKPEVNIKEAWYKLIIALAGEDFLNIHQVVERPLMEALNFLTWLKSKRQDEERKMRTKINKLKNR
jgi:hypothetical protein